MMKINTPHSDFKIFQADGSPPAYVVNANVLDYLRWRLPEQESDKFHAILTSPPFFGQRDYGVPSTLWGVSDPDCPHEHWKDTPGPRTKMALQGCTDWKHVALQGDQPPPANEGAQRGKRCLDCGAWCGALGQESDPREYVDHLLEVIDICMKNLRQDGNMWLEIGDVSISKCMAGVPHLLFVGIVYTLGYYVRRENIWNVSNKKPQSQRDTTTLAHSQVFHIVHPCKQRFWTHARKIGTRKRPKSDTVWVHRRTGVEVPEPLVSNKRLRKLYWMRRSLWEGHDYHFDLEAIREPYASDTASSPVERRRALCTEQGGSTPTLCAETQQSAAMAHAGGSIGPVSVPFDGVKVNDAVEWILRASRGGKFDPSLGSRFDKGKSGVIHGRVEVTGDREYSPRGRSPRTVWTGSSALFKGNHFACMPLWLAEKCLKASISPVGCCPECGAQWARRVIHGQSEHHCRPGCGCENDPGYDENWAGYGGFLASSLSTDEFLPTCGCADESGRPLEPVPSTVMDPFSGVATTLQAARNVGAASVGVELSEKYAMLGIERLESS